MWRAENWRWNQKTWVADRVLSQQVPAWGLRPLGLQYWLQHLTLVWPWAHDWISWSFHFLVYKWGKVWLIGPFSLLRKCWQNTPQRSWQAIKYSINIYDGHHQTQNTARSCKSELEVGGPGDLSSKCLGCLNMLFNCSPVIWCLVHLESNGSQKPTGCSAQQLRGEDGASTVTLKST